MNTIKRKTFRISILLPLVVALLGFSNLWGGQAQAATLPAETCTLDTLTNTRTCELWATTGTLNLPDGTSAPIWGFADSATGAAMLPGPALIAHQGETVQVILHNGLGEATALLFKGQDMIPDLTGVAAGADNTAWPYTFTASTPGTYLYEAGLLPNAEHQVAMGMFGALIVRPDPAFASISGTNTVEDLLGTTLTDSAADFTGLDYLVGGTLSNTTDGSSCTIAGFTATTLTCAAPLAGGTANTWALDDAYTATAGTSFAYSSVATAYDDEALLVLSEVDPALNNSADPAGFDMRDYAPRYFLINGLAYPQTDPIPALAGDSVLLRYVNAGLQHHSMALLGSHQIVAAVDGDARLYPYRVVAETIAPGQTMDMLVAMPAVAPAGGAQYALYDADLLLHNNGTAAFGGMMTFVSLADGTAPGTGPSTGAVSLTPNPTNGSVDVTVSATIPGATSAEYFIDAQGTGGSGLTMGPGAGTDEWTGTISTTDLAGLSSGNHTIYVHGSDGTLWGSFNFAVLNLDTAGPATTGLTLTPNPTNGSVDVALHATGDDSATGGSNISAAEYTIDGGASAAMTVNAAAPVSSLDATIPAATVNGLAEGAHVVSVRSQDALGNWGAFATINLIVDKTGPAASNVAAVPNPTNGVIGFNASTSAVRVSATFSDTLSKISAGEGFIDMVGANGTGFIFLPSDGSFNSLSENGYVDIPLTTINGLGEGSHTISVHGKDAAGNWGATSSISLVVDKTAPTLTSVTLSPATIAFGTANTQLTVSASDAGSGVSGGQYWIDGTATPPANATAFTGTSATLDTSALAGGVHTVYARVQDAAGNWSTVSSATLTVVQAIDDAVTIAANTQASQQINIAAPGLLANDEPIGDAGRTAALATAPVRIDTTGNLGTLTVTCPPSSAPGVCADGSYRITLNADPGAQGGNARRASKQGIYQFTYTEFLNGVPSIATVTITVN